MDLIKYNSSRTLDNRGKAIRLFSRFLFSLLWDYLIVFMMLNIRIVSGNYIADIIDWSETKFYKCVVLSC